MNRELLAATSVFAEMVNKNVDYKNVIDDFIISIFKVEKNHIIDSKEAAKLLTEKYDFDIPEAIIKSHLKRLERKKILANNNGKYSITNIDISDEQLKLSKSIEDKISGQKIILESLIIFIENNSSSKILEKDELEEFFINYLFDKNHDGKYSELVSRFIVVNSNNEQFKEELNLIREGVTILKGIKYTPDNWTPKNWSKELNLYLDTELLFSIAGLNGELFKKILMDFYSLVKAINNSSASKKINLYYFKEVEVEVKNFFSAAQKIIRGQPNSYINSQAMIDITRGVNEVSEIINKESHFFDLLKGMGIKPYDRIEMSDENLIKYNVTSKDLIDKYGYSDLKTEEVIQSILVTFTKLNYLRKGKNSENLENIGHLIVSGKSLTKSLSLDNESKFNEKDFSFASDIYYLTEKLWYKLHKGLGFKGSLPITFDAVTKAQIIVSNKINLKARERFDQLKLDVQSGSENEQSVKEYYLNLRSYCIKPEELTSENVESKAMFIYDDTTPEEFAKEILMIKSENEELKRFKKKVEESKDKERALKIEEFQKKIQKKILSNYKKYELIKLVANILYYFVLLILIIILIYLCIKSKETCFNTLNTVMAVVSFLYFLGIKKFKIYVERFCNNKHAKYKLDIEKNTQNL